MVQKTTSDVVVIGVRTLIRKNEMTVSNRKKTHTHTRIELWITKEKNWNCMRSTKFKNIFWSGVGEISEMKG